MEECSCHKSTVRSTEEKRALTVRINRIIGQMGGIRKMVEEDRYCEDVLIQLAAADRALRSLASLVLERHLHTCVVDNVKAGNEDVVDEIVALFKRFQ